MNSIYPNLDQLMWGYFGEDFDIWGRTVPEIISRYREGVTESTRVELIHEIDEFIRLHEADLETAFESTYEYDFNPKLWGYTAASFLEEVKRLMQA